MKIIIVVFVSLIISSAIAQFPKVNIDNTEIRKISSTIAGQKYLLFVALPRKYNNSSKEYPVIYSLDGHWVFPMLCPMYNSLLGDGSVPEAIIVGITWDAKNPNYDSLRQREYTVAKENTTSGPASKFLECIKKELIPFIETNYRANKKNRILLGASLGGYFGIYAFFHDASLFHRYILVSPSLIGTGLDWDNDSFLKEPRKDFRKNATSKTKLFISKSDQDPGQSDIEKFVEELKLKDVEVTNVTLPGFGHSGGIPEGIMRGLQSAFKRPALFLDSTLLNHYAGTYEKSQGDNFVLFRKSSKLFMQYSDKLVFPLEAENRSDFYINGVNIRFKFIINKTKTIDGVNIIYDSGESYYKKIK
jgi:predicted alpha/beta superfamily hydrolase